MFAAEQTWPTEDELKSCLKKPQRKGSLEEMETDEVDMSDVKPKIEKAEDLSNLFDKMQITVVGKEHGNDKDDFVGSDTDDEDSVGDAEAELAYM